MTLLILLLLLGAPALARSPRQAATAEAASPIDQQLQWVVASLAPGAAPLAVADLEAHFAPAFLAQVPAAQLQAVFQQLPGQAGPLTFERVESGATDLALSAVLSSERIGFLRLHLSIEPQAPHAIVGLLIQPAPDLSPKVGSWEEVEAHVRAVAPEVNLLAAELVEGRCQALHAVEPDAALAIGSTFKLYELAALADEVATGHRAWTDPLPIEEAHKSLPSGVLQEEPAGEIFTLREVAEKMISISDNTAADHLLFHLGRPAVEAAMIASGSQSAARNQPFLTTREMFTFKLLLDPKEQAAWLALDPEGRRQELSRWDALDLAPALTAAASWTSPRQIDQVEWFASPNDLCGLALELRAHAEVPATAPVADILSINPGIPDPAGEWRAIEFKGGSEPGVMNLTWILQRERDGRWFFLSLGFNDPEAPIAEGAAIAVATEARAFLAAVGP